MDISITDILNKRFALREYLENKKYHHSTNSIPKEDISPEFVQPYDK